MRTTDENGNGWPRNFFPEKNLQNSIIGYPYPDPRVAQPVLIGGIIVVLPCILLGVPWYWWFPAGFTFLMLACSACKQVIVDMDTKAVRVHYRLFLRWKLKCESFSFNQFKAIIYILHPSTDDWPLKRVGLLSNEGKRYWIRGFGCDDATARSSRGAESLAWRLSCDTGIQIEDKPVKTFFWVN